MNSNTLFNFLVKLQAITKIGLLYSTDPYAIRNYQEIQSLTLSMLEDMEAIRLDRNNYFERDVYPTPNVSVRTIIFNEQDEFLMVREKQDGGFSFPGGWADLYDSPTEAAIRESKEEAGADIKIEGVVALLNRTPLKEPTLVPEYVIVFKAKLVSLNGFFDHEITEVGWFKRHTLPVLSRKVTKTEIERMLDAALANIIIYD
ncbi:MAG: NUDIX hydrolase N-terminal domain-containing protein [Bacilli bacterium]|jgi:8-oxo-dGTP diphosphatase